MVDPGPVRRTRPVALRKLPGGRVADHLALPSPALLELLDQAPRPTGDLSGAAPRTVLLVTFRRSGARVATPVWVGWSGGLAFARTQRGSGKVKRLRNDGTVLVAPCTTRGEPTSGARTGYARVLPAGEERSAERALRAHHGRVRALCAWIQDRLRVDMCYLEIRVDERSGDDGSDAAR